VSGVIPLNLQLIPQDAIAGGGSGIGSSGLTPTAIVTSSVSAASGTIVRVDSTSAALSITLPASPSDGDRVGVLDVSGAFSTHPSTILRNGKLIQGIADDILLDVERSYTEWMYVSATGSWEYLGASSSAFVGSGSIADFQNAFNA
jgi:hypothetical protein